jgi:hypothetical protein
LRIFNNFEISYKFRCQEFGEENQLIRKRNDEQSIIIQVLQDEMQALQLELIKAEGRTKELEAENRTLLERWLKKMNEEVSKMNESLVLTRR